MNTFAMVLCDSVRVERFGAVSRFAGADDSGAFGILPHHAPAVFVLRYGLARFLAGDTWHYLALPGGVLRFSGNVLTLAAARYFRGDERGRLTEQLAAELAREDSEVHAARATLAEIERTLVRRLGELGARTRESR